MMSDIKLAVVGSRYFKDYDLMCEVLERFIEQHGQPSFIISGGASGADSLAEQWADENDIQTVIFHADWERWGKSAGFKRNKLIVAEATHVVAFPLKNSKGTKSTIKLAQEAGKPIEIHWC